MTLALEVDPGPPQEGQGLLLAGARGLVLPDLSQIQLAFVQLEPPEKACHIFPDQHFSAFCGSFCPGLGGLRFGQVSKNPGSGQKTFGYETIVLRPPKACPLWRPWFRLGYELSMLFGLTIGFVQLAACKAVLHSK